MNTQINHTENEKTSLNNLNTGNWIVILSGALYVISLFLDWTTNGFFIVKGYAFLEIRTSFASGMPQLNLITLLTVLGCIFLCIPFLKGKNSAKLKRLSITQIILSVLGISLFILLPFELKTWTPPANIGFGAWLAMAAALGVLTGAILSFIKIRNMT